MNHLFQVTRLSAIHIIFMTRHRSNECIQNLEFHQARNSDSKVIITVSQLFSSMCHMLVQKQIIQRLAWKKQFSDEGGKAIRGVLLFSRTLLLSIFCYLFSIIFLCMCHSCKFFTVNFIYSDLSFDCLNRLTVYTVSINRFTSLKIVFNLPFESDLITRFNHLKCSFRSNTAVYFVCCLEHVRVILVSID